VRRRFFLKGTASIGAALATKRFALSAQTPAPPRPPVIDAHVHLYDTARPGGVPWPLKDDTVIYKPALPERYKAVSAGLGVVGAIAIEASPLPSDNDWVLAVAAKNPIIVGMVGDLVPGSPSYEKELERLHRNPLFLGIRYGNLWDRDLSVDIHKPGFLDGLKDLARYGLVLESANPDPKLIAAIVEVANHTPELTIVVDHLPHATVPTEPSMRAAYLSHLQQLGRSPHVFVKMSEILVEANGSVAKNAAFYKEDLDRIWDTFGEDQMLYGSDWPNSDHLASYAETFSIAKEYVTAKGPAATEKFFWKNSIRAYKWHPREANQSIATS
jgi:L-fuconolactonase